MISPAIDSPVLDPSRDSAAETAPMDFVIVGAGVSGIGMAAHLQRKCPWASFVILEAREQMGGTWDLFRYPGIRSDSDMFSFSYSFRPWDKDQAIADGSEILAYLKETARIEGVEDKIRYKHKVVSARWSTPEALWRITVEADGTPMEMECRFLVAATGYYRYDHGYQPDFQGLSNYKGRFVHPQHWPADLDWTDKRVLVIGSGATAITLVPSMAEKASKVVMLQRSPTYVFPRPGSDPLAARMQRILPQRASGTLLRWANALFLEWSYRYSRNHPEKMKALFRSVIKRQLPKDFDVDKHFKPSYDPWDQRMCIARDGDLFKAISAGKVEVVTDIIETFTEKGLRVSSGEEIEADIVVSATGLELLFLGGIQVELDGEHVNTTELLSYKGMMLDGMPNAVAVTGYINNSWTLKADLTADFVCRLANKMRSEHKAYVVPRADGVQRTGESVLNLKSGYVQRAVDRMPKQGSRDPWRLGESYLKDWGRLKFLALHDDCLKLYSRAGNGSGRSVVVSSRGAEGPVNHGAQAAQRQAEGSLVG